MVPLLGRPRRNGRPPALGGPAVVVGRPAAQLERGADGAEDRADLTPQEEEGDDRDDRDESKNQRVLGETLAVFIGINGSDKSR